MKDGNDLISAMQKQFGRHIWSTDHLIKFLHERQMGRTIFTTDPNENEHCIELSGKFSIAELDALVIAQTNEGKEESMLTWYTTTEWIALQFNGKNLEELNENETNIAKRLIDEGYLVAHQVSVGNSSSKVTVTKLCYTHKPE